MSGNPVGRNIDDGMTLEVSRLCTDGTKNACSMLYGASARVAKEMGYRKIITYILSSESGTSLKASGWICEGVAGALKWTSNRQTIRDSQKQLSIFADKKPPEEMKQRWGKTLK